MINSGQSIGIEIFINVQCETETGALTEQSLHIRGGNSKYGMFVMSEEYWNPTLLGD